MSPEQATRTRGSLSTATDVYGLGTILYALLTGRAPFAGTTLVETLDKVRSQPPEPPSRLNPRVPRDLEVICRKCLEKDPSRRYASAQALAEDLTRWQNGEPIRARPVGAAGPRRDVVPSQPGAWPRRRCSSMLALAGGFAGVTWQWRKAEHEPRQRPRASSSWSAIACWPGRRRARPSGQEPDRSRAARPRRGEYRRLGRRPARHRGPAPRDDRRGLSLAGRIRSGGEAASARRSASTRNSRGRGAAARWGPPTCWPRSSIGQADPPRPSRLLRRNLDDCRRFLGPDDPITLDAAERLGSLLWHLGKSDEAEAVLRKNVADRSRVLQPGARRHAPLHLISSAGSFANAASSTRPRKWPTHTPTASSARGATNHPDIIAALTNQGDVARAQDKVAEAEQYYRHAAVEAARILGPQHRDTLAAEATRGE